MYKYHRKQRGYRSEHLIGYHMSGDVFMCLAIIFSPSGRGDGKTVA